MSGNGTQLGERSLMLLTQQAAARIQGLVPGPAVGTDHAVHHHLRAGGRIDAGRVAAQDHRQPIGGDAHSPQRPQ